MNEKLFEKYFQNELNKLQNLAKEFSLEHPAVAPLLNAHNADPDVERLLEGVSFLTALLNQKLDNEFPEVVHALMNILFPHYLRPVPALSIVEFSPKPSLREVVKISKETIIKSIPIDDVACSFSTTSDLNMYPIILQNTSYKSNEQEKNKLILDLEVINTDMATLQLEALDFYLNDSYGDAANLFMLLSYYLESIRIEFDDIKIPLKTEVLQCKGFKRENSLFDYPRNSLSSYMILQEYFILPQTFFFFTIENLQRLKNYKNLTKFKIVFDFKKTPIHLTSLSNEAIKLFCVPAKNLFEEKAEPITLTHHKELIHVNPPLKHSDKYQIYDIKKVSGYIQGEAKQRDYVPFESFEKDKEDKNIYQVHRKISIVNGEEELYLSLHYNDKEELKKETLSLTITCTNGKLPERLQLGEISQGSDNSPELTTFKNITPCTMQIESPVDENSLWQFISHLSINLLTLADLMTFKEMLRLYIFPNNRDKNRVAKNQKRIDAIEEFEVYPIDMVSRGYLLKGHKVVMGVRQDYFASLGDLYLFCSVILQFLGSYAALNTFIELEVKEKITGESFKWTPILGSKKLL